MKVNDISLRWKLLSSGLGMMKMAIFIVNIAVMCSVQVRREEGKAKGFNFCILKFGQSLLQWQ